MADLTFKIDADTGGFLGAIKKAGTTIKDFGLIGGPPILAVKAAMAGVEGAAKLAEAAVKGVGTAASSVAAGGRSMVGLLNQVNGAVELMNKVLPALTFPLMMAKNAEKVTGAFNELKTSWEGVAGALGEGVNDALTPILKAAGVEVGKLKEKAREVGKGIGDAIDFARVSYQMGTLPEILWLGLQKVTLQWGASLLEFFTTFGFKVQRIMDNAINGTIAAALEAIGMDDMAAKTRAGSDSRQASSQGYEAEALAGMKDFLSPVYDKIGRLGEEMDTLAVPVKARISEEKTLAEVTAATSAAFTAVKAGLSNFFGTGEKAGSEGKAKSKGQDDFVGPMQGYSDEQTQRAAEELGLARKSKPAPASSPAAAISSPTETSEAEPPGRVNSAAENKLGRRLIRGAGFGGKMAQKLEAKNLAQNVTNKGGSGGADKKEREAAQKDSKTSSAIDTVIKTLPGIALSIQSMAKDLSQAQSR